MDIETTDFPGLIVIRPKVFEDERGYFFESWQEERYRDAGIAERFVQDNRSYSRAGILRGLHYQKRHPHGQLVWIVEGEIFDVVVDLRRDSPTFRKWYGRHMSAKTPEQIYMPPGFAHGFCVLGDSAAVHYKCTGQYRPNDEGGLNWKDPDIGIDWPVDGPMVSARDEAFPNLADFKDTDYPDAECR